MRIFTIALAVMFAAGALATAAEAGKTKNAPGKCGVGKYFDKKTKKCTAK